MSWYDWITLVIMAVVTIIQTVRGSRAGMGLPLFEAAGVVVAAAAATAFAHGVAGPIHASDNTVMLALFILFSVLAFFVARWLFALAALSFQSLDGILSLFCGLVMAWAVAHMFLRIMIGSAEGEAAEAIANSPVAREVYQFHTWNALIRLLFKVKAGPDNGPDLG
jgi:uncharacterized membrane protein required for colicin V production